MAHVNDLDIRSVEWKREFIKTHLAITSRLVVGTAGSREGQRCGYLQIRENDWLKNSFAI